MNFPNCLMTAHQAALYYEAHSEIARITLQNIYDMLTTGKSPNIIV